MPSRASKTRRADELLALRGFVESQKQGAALILAGTVMVTEASNKERKVLKPGEPLSEQVRFRLKGESKPYVSRAGRKLEAGLERFGLSVEGKVALDLGLSTGGFTDCLLQRGVLRVHGVDVGYGIVDWKIRSDPRLVLHERTNAKDLRPEHLNEPIALVVMDLSFIGLEALWPVLPPLLGAKADIVALIKPQFELPSSEVSEGGIVRSGQARARAVQRTVEGARASGLRFHDSIESPIAGTRGNIEHLAWFSSP